MLVKSAAFRIVSLFFVFALLPLVHMVMAGEAHAEAGGAPAAGTLSFTVKRPEFSANENMVFTYSEYWQTQPNGGGVVDPATGDLKDFAITYELSGAGVDQPIERQLTYTVADYSWSNNGKVAFEGIPLVHKDVQVQYYAPDGQQFFEPYLLKYQIILEDAGDHMVLKVPRLRPDSVEQPTGEEKVVTIVDLNVVEKAIYLDGRQGSDSNDGLTPATPVKSFAKAKELAAADQSLGTIYVQGEVPISGDINLDGTSAKVVRAPGYRSYLFNLAAGKSATLSNITLDGGGEKAGAFKSLIRAFGDLTITEGTVLENNIILNTNGERSFGGAIRVGDAPSRSTKLTMTGGIIRNNQASDGGGIFLDRAHFRFSGGVIENNRAVRFFDRDTNQYHSAGGGIQAYRGSSIELMGDAVIRANRSDEIGGGISLGDNSWTVEPNTLTMTGGTIDSNVAGAAGGGLFVQAAAQGAQHVATISAGYITNNQMDGSGWGDKAFGGGGIYVNGAKDGFAGLRWKLGQLNLTNAIITDNTSEYEGAGFAACPISVTDIKLSNGTAIYGNTAKAVGVLAEGAQTPVNEVFFYSNPYFGYHGGYSVYSVSDTMLGGVPYNWTDVATGQPLAKDKYAGELRPAPGKSQGFLGLNTQAQPSARTQSLAKVFITGNYSATRGGGIGSNGGQTFGTDDPLTEVPVKKQWDDAENQDAIRPASITVSLLADGEETGYSLELNEDNNWSDAFVYLPKQKTIADGQGSEEKVDIVYTVQEVLVNGYVGTIDGNMADGFTITNTHTPEVTSLNVHKKWIAYDGSELRTGLPQFIELQLIADDGQGVQPVGAPVRIEPDAEGNWEHTFVDLPEKRGGKVLTYTVQETQIPGFTSQVNQVSADRIVVKNTQDAPPPENPPTPPTPPVTPPTPPTPPVPPKAPPVLAITGANSALTAAVLFAGVVGIGILTIRRSRKR